VNILAGFGLAPIALAVAPLAIETQNTDGGHGSRDRDRDGALALYRALELSPSCARRDHCGLGGQTWPKESGYARFAPGHDSETYFKQTFTRAGGEVPLALRVPLLNPDFAPFLQRVRDTSPDGVPVDALGADRSRCPTALRDREKRRRSRRHRARAKSLREHGFTKMAAEHEQVAQAIERRRRPEQTE
jgi:hypothetical protein